MPNVGKHSLQAAIPHPRIKAGVPPARDMPLAVGRKAGPAATVAAAPGLLSGRLRGPETHHHFWVEKS